MRLWVGMPLAFLIGISTGLFMISPVDVNAGPICFEANYNVVFQPGADTNRRGVKVTNPGMRTFDNTESCARVSTIFIYHSGNDFVEMGWYEDPDGGIPLCPATTGQPRVFAWTEELGNSVSCEVGSYIDQGESWEYLIQDVNNDGLWTFKFDGGVFDQTEDMWWHFGLPLDNGERHTTAGTNHAQADFNGLQFRNSVEWKDWSTEGNAILWDDDDPGYKGCRYDGGDRTTVIPNANTC